LALAWHKFRFVTTADYYGLAKNPLRYAFFTNEWTIFQFFVTADYAGFAKNPLRYAFFIKHYGSDIIVGHLLAHTTPAPTRKCPEIPLPNIYAKPAPTSFHAGCTGNRSVESPSIYYSMRQPPPMLFFTQKYYFKFI
jgi:hypothetical protein